MGGGEGVVTRIGSGWAESETASGATSPETCHDPFLLSSLSLFPTWPRRVPPYWPLVWLV